MLRENEKKSSKMVFKKKEDKDKSTNIEKRLKKIEKQLVEMKKR
jgi:hypothetical protein